MSGSSSKTTKLQRRITGSPVAGEPVFLAVGKLRRTHGLEGFLVMELWTDFPQRMQPHRKVYIGVDKVSTEIRAVRVVNDGLLIRFVGDATTEDARAKTNSIVYVRSDEVPELPEGEYYHFQLIGMQVQKSDGAVLGTLTDILETGANDVYVVKPESGAELLLPAIADVILHIDVERKVMVVNPPAWD